MCSHNYAPNCLCNIKRDFKKVQMERYKENGKKKVVRERETEIEINGC